MQRILNYIAPILPYKNIDHAWEKKTNPNQNHPTNEPIQNTTNQTIKINTGFQKGDIKSYLPYITLPKCNSNVR